VRALSQSDQVVLDLVRPFQYIMIDNKLPATISLTLQLTWRRHHLGTLFLPDTLVKECAMAKTKYMSYECAYCRKTTKMELVGETQTEGSEEPALKAWYRCTRCKHSALLDKPIPVSKKGDQSKIEKSACVTYSRGLVFKVGQAIYHEEWDDVGKVTAKQKISAGMQSITVSFEKLGERRLIENMPQSAEPEFIESVPVRA